MRGAPPVQMACGRDARWRWSHRVLSVAAGVTACTWMAARLELPAAVVILALLAGVALGVWWSARWDTRQTRSTLVWDGRSWCLDGQAGVVEVMLDFGSWMLLRFLGGGPGSVRWLPLCLAQAGAPAHLCRAALLDQAAMIAAADAHPPVAPNG